MYLREAYLCVLLICQTVWCFQRYYNYTRNYVFDGRTCGINEEALHIGNALSVLVCSSACSHENTCMSFFYQWKTQQCYGCRIAYGENNNKVPTQDLADSVYFTRYRFLGCFNDYPQRILEGNFEYNAKMTTELCSSRCLSAGYKYALTEDNNWCDCGNVLKHGNQIPDNLCNTPCAGDVSRNCGGLWRGSLYILQP